MGCERGGGKPGQVAGGLVVTAAAVGAGATAGLSELQCKERAVQRVTGSGPPVAEGLEVTANQAHSHLLGTQRGRHHARHMPTHTEQGLLG